MFNEKELAEDLISFIDNSPTAFHAVDITRDLLLENGFTELFLEDKWELEKGGIYFVTKNYSALIAFRVGENELEKDGFRIIGAHTDAPGFKIKPNSEMLVKDNYLKLNTEVYGGPILSTWFDRPLSIAGKVSLKGEHPLSPKEMLIDFEKPLLTIPNLAIHMNRTVNDGYTYNAQNDTLPLVGLVNDTFEKENFLLGLLAEELEVEIDEILDFELYLYATEKGQIIGLNEEFVSIGKLDDLAMVHAGINGLLDAYGEGPTNVLIAFDNEEVGSRTKQGAASPMAKNVLKRIALSQGKDEEEFLRALSLSFIISADQAHAVHPNFTEKADPTNQPIMNQGPVIKMAANQAYTTDATSGAVYAYICELAEVPVQRFTNRSDAKGGSTIGPISSSQLDIPSVDIGNPILAMHSVRELGGVMDHYYVYKSFIEFYSL